MHGIPEAREGLSNVVLFGVTQQRHIAAGMAADPLADALTEPLLQLRPGLILPFNEGTVQEVESLAIIESFFPPMSLRLLGTRVRKGGQLHLTDCFVHGDAHRSRSPFPSTAAEFASAEVKQFSLFSLIECTSCVLVICLEHT